MNNKKLSFKPNNFNSFRIVNEESSIIQGLNQLTDIQFKEINLSMFKTLTVLIIMCKPIKTEANLWVNSIK